MENILSTSEAKKTLLMLYLPTGRYVSSNQPLGKASIATMWIRKCLIYSIFKLLFSNFVESPILNILQTPPRMKYLFDKAN